MHLETPPDHYLCKIFVTVYIMLFTLEIPLAITFTVALHQCCFLRILERQTKTPKVLKMCLCIDADQNLMS